MSRPLFLSAIFTKYVRTMRTCSVPRKRKGACGKKFLQRAPFPLYQSKMLLSKKESAVLVSWSRPAFKKRAGAFFRKFFKRRAGAFPCSLPAYAISFRL